MSNLLNLYGYSQLNDIQDINADIITSSYLNTDFFNDIPASFFTGLTSNIQNQINNLMPNEYQIVDNIVLQANGIKSIFWTNDGNKPAVNNIIVTKIYGKANNESHIDFNTSLNINKTNNTGTVIDNLISINSLNFTSILDFVFNCNIEISNPTKIINPLEHHFYKQLLQLH